MAILSPEPFDGRGDWHDSKTPGLAAGAGEAYMSRSVVTVVPAKVKDNRQLELSPLNLYQHAFGPFLS
jgi:hypothetical protein